MSASAEIARLNPERSYVQAQDFERAGKVDEAERLYRELLKSFPNQPALLHRLAHLLKKRGAIAEAEALLRRVIALAPGEPAAHNNLGNVLRVRGRPVDAEHCFRTALKLEPNYPSAHYNLGIVLEEQGRLADALAAYQTAVALRPDFAAPRVRVGVILLHDGRHLEALEEFDQALCFEPDSFDAHYYRGSALTALERYDEAIAARAWACSVWPEHFDAALAAANTLRAAGRFDEAIDAYWHLVEMDPSRVATHDDINRIAWVTGREDVFMRSFAYARNRLGEGPELLRAEAVFHAQRDRQDVAEAALRRALAIAPESHDISGFLARVLAKQRKFAESFEMFEAALRAVPRSTLHLKEYGFALLMNGQSKDAIALFERGLAIAPEDQLLLAGKGLALRETDEAMYNYLVDSSRFVRVYELGSATTGFSDAAAFNRQLAQELDAMHTTKVEPIEQTLRGGTQTHGVLFERRSRMVARIRERIEEAVADYIAHLPDDPDHPMLARKENRFSFSGSWSCRLRSGGYHTNHVHSMGWISSAYYVDVPDEISDAHTEAGWLRFGQSNLSIGERDAPEMSVQPVVGRLVLFPSYFWHGTAPFASDSNRLTIAFDVLPGEPAGSAFSLPG